MSLPLSAVGPTQADDADRRAAPRDHSHVEHVIDRPDDDLARLLIPLRRRDERAREIEIREPRQRDAVLDLIAGVLGGIELDGH
jgi:hypothetical protein